MQDIDAEIGEIRDFKGNVEEVRGNARLADREGPDVQLVDDHVGKIRRDEILIMPGKAIAGAQDVEAVRKAHRIKFARAGIALVAA